MPDPSNVRPNPLTPRYRFNEALGRYIDPSGRMVPQVKVTRALERQITKSEQALLDLAGQLQSGEIDLAEWRTGMLSELKTLHIANAAAARGGWAQMGAADYGQVGGRLAKQYEYLNRFTSQVQYGTQPLDGKFIQRVKMYAGAARDTYQRTRDQVADELGYDEERNILQPAEHCQECLDQSALGWVPRGTLIPIGARICKSNCKCRKRYRNSRTGRIFE